MLTNLLTIQNAQCRAGDVTWPLDTDGLDDLEGAALFDRLFPNDDASNWYQALTGPLLIQDDDTTGALWESLHDGDGFTALTRGLARVVDNCADSADLAPLDRPLRILFALASPVHEPTLDEADPRQPTPINLQARIDLLRDLQDHEFPADFRVEKHVSVARLQEALAGGCDVLHVAAHGNEGGVCLERRDWTRDFLPSHSLARIAARAGLRLVVLESCLTAAPDREHDAPAVAEAVVRAGVRLAIAMAGAVSGPLANVFTNRVYQNIAEGRDIIEACCLARIRMAELCEDRQYPSEDWRLPALFVDRRALTDRAPCLTTHAAGALTLSGHDDRWPDPLMQPSPTFVGRGPQLAEIAKYLDPEPSTGVAAEKLLLTGHGGIGKTELALQAADRARRWFPDGVVCVTGRDRPVPEGLAPAAGDELLLVKGPRQLAETLAERLHIEFDATTSDADLVRDIAATASDRRVLLLLDNLEPFADSALITGLLQALGGRCRVLATSRHELKKLPLPTLDVPPLSEADASAMVHRRAAGLGIHRVLPARRIARASRQTPLVIALAVGRIAEGHTEERVISDLQAFKGADVEALVKYAFERTLDAATEEQALLFGCAALYPGPARRAALQAASGLDDATFEEALAGALRLSLLEELPFEQGPEAAVLSEPNVRRVALLPLARAVAEGQLSDDKALDDLRLRTADECASFVDAADDLLTPDRVAARCRPGGTLAPLAKSMGGPAAVAQAAYRAALAALDAEWTSAADLAEWAFAGERWDLVARFTQALVSYLQARALWADWQRLCRFGLDAARSEGSRAREGIALNNLGLVYRAQGRWDEALEGYEQSLAISRDLGDRDAEGRTLNNIGTVYGSLGRWHVAIACYEQSLAVCRDLGARLGEGGTLNNLGGVYQTLGDRNEAIACYEQSLTIFRDLGDRHGEGATLNNLGGVYGGQGRWDEAIECYERSLAIKRDLGDPHGEAETLNNLGGVYSPLRHWQDAVRCCEQSLAIFRDLGDRPREGETLNALGMVYQQLGRWAEAMECYEQSLAIKRDLRDRDGLVRTLRNLALAHEATQGLSEATTFMAEAMKWSLELHETRVVETTRQSLDIAKSIATRADWHALTTFAKALTDEVHKAHQQGSATQEIAAAAQQSLKVFETIRLVAEAEADPQRPAFTKARTLAQQLDESTDSLYNLTTWLNDLRAPD